MTSRPHTIRIPDQLWDLATRHARTTAAKTNTSVSTTHVVIEALNRYLAPQLLTQMDAPDASSPTRRKTAEKLTVSSSTSGDWKPSFTTTPETAGYTESATSTMNARDLNLRKGLVDRHGEDSELVRQFDESHR